MEKITFYDADGRITGVMSGPPASVQATVDYLKEPFVEGEGNLETDYVNNGMLASRPACPAVFDGRTLSGLPVPSLIKINEQDYPCEASTVELEFDQPGKYRVVIKAWPYLDKEFTIENPA